MLNSQSFTPTVIQTIQHTQRDFAGPLAQHLVDSLHIQQGNSLVPYLGYGFESSNQDALESWVYMVCTSLKIPFSSASLSTLESILAPALDALRNERTLSLDICEVTYD